MCPRCRCCRRVTRAVCFLFQGQGGGQGGGGEKARSPNNRRMDRLRRSFRDSFRRRKEPSLPESSKPHQWQLDEAAVRAGTCCFHVKVGVATPVCVCVLSTGTAVAV